MKKIFIDYDTTLVDFQDVMTRQINAREDTNFTSLQLSRGYHDEIKMRNKDLFVELNIYEEILPFGGAIKFLNSLQALDYETVLITANMSEAQKNFKTTHIEEHFDGIFHDIIHAEDKYNYTKDSILIDDSYANITSHIHHNNSVGILFNLNHEYIITDKLDLELENLHHMSSFQEIINYLKRGEI